MDLFFNMPVKLFVETDAVQKHRELFGSYGRRCLIVTGKSSAKACGALEDVVAALEANGVVWQLFDQVEQNPLVSTCHRGGQAAAAFGADFLVGIGGGSPLDATKAVAVYAANPALSPMGLYKGWENPALPFLLVGTTAGTGSEVTCFSVLTVDETGRKSSWGNDQSYARAVFGDWRYTQSLPMDFTMSTGLDAVAHALEAYFNKKRDELSDLFAVKALQLLLPALKSVWVSRELPDAHQRETLYRASIYAGLALNRCGTACCHMMSYYLSEEVGTPHGYACAVFLPELIRQAVPEMPRESQRLFKEIGMYAGELCDTIRMLTQAEFAAIDDATLERLLARWEGGSNMLRTPGDFNTEKQREAAIRVLQKKGEHAL